MAGTSPKGLFSVMTPAEKWLFGGVAAVTASILGYLFVADLGNSGAITHLGTDLREDIADIREENRDDTLEAIINELREDIAALTNQVQTMNRTLVDVRIDIADKIARLEAAGAPVPSALVEDLNRVDEMIIREGENAPAELVR